MGALVAGIIGAIVGKGVGDEVRDIVQDIIDSFQGAGQSNDVRAGSFIAHRQVVRRFDMRTVRKQ